jgi:rubrerythrin
MDNCIANMDNWISEFKKGIPDMDKLFSNLADIKSWNFFKLFNSCTEGTTVDQVVDTLPESTANQDANQEANQEEIVEAIQGAIEDAKNNEEKVETVSKKSEKSRKKTKKQGETLTTWATAYRDRLKKIRSRLQIVLKNVTIHKIRKPVGQAQSNHMETLRREGMNHHRRPAS